MKHNNIYTWIFYGELVVFCIKYLCVNIFMFIWLLWLCSQFSDNEEVCFSVSDVKPVFGVPLALAVDRSKCHDCVPLPAIFRECIDYIQEFGMI